MSESSPVKSEPNSIRKIRKGEFHSAVFIDRVLWAKVKKYATILEVSATKTLGELAFRILLAIFDARHVPDDLGDLLQSRDPEALDLLLSLVNKLQRLGVENG